MHTFKFFGMAQSVLFGLPLPGGEMDFPEWKGQTSLDRILLAVATPAVVATSAVSAKRKLLEFCRGRDSTEAMELTPFRVEVLSFHDFVPLETELTFYSDGPEACVVVIQDITRTDVVRFRQFYNEICWTLGMANRDHAGRFELLDCDDDFPDFPELDEEASKDKEDYLVSRTKQLLTMIAQASCVMERWYLLQELATLTDSSSVCCETVAYVLGATGPGMALAEKFLRPSLHPDSDAPTRVELYLFSVAIKNSVSSSTKCSALMEEFYSVLTAVANIQGALVSSQLLEAARMIGKRCKFHESLNSVLSGGVRRHKTSIGSYVSDTTQAAPTPSVDFMETNEPHMLGL